MKFTAIWKMRPMNNPHWFYFYIIPLLPTALTIAGWFFVYRREQSKRRLDRRDKRIEMAVALLDKIASDTLAYYADSHDKGNQTANRIKQNLKWLGILCARIDSSLDKPFTGLRTVCSGGDFEARQRKALPPEHQKFIEIHDSVFRLRDTLDKCHDEIRKSRPLNDFFRFASNCPLSKYIK